MGTACPGARPGPVCDGGFVLVLSASTSSSPHPSCWARPAETGRRPVPPGPPNKGAGALRKAHMRPWLVLLVPTHPEVAGCNLSLLPDGAGGEPNHPHGPPSEGTRGCIPASGPGPPPLAVCLKCQLPPRRSLLGLGPPPHSDPLSMLKLTIGDGVCRGH